MVSIICTLFYSAKTWPRAKITANVAVGFLVFMCVRAADGETPGQLTATTFSQSSPARSTSERFSGTGRRSTFARNSVVAVARDRSLRWLEIGTVGTTIGRVSSHGYSRSVSYPEPCQGADLEHTISPNGNVGACLAGVFHRLVPEISSTSRKGILIFDPASGKVRDRFQLPDALDGFDAIAFLDDEDVAVLVPDQNCPRGPNGHATARVWTISLKTKSVDQSKDCVLGIFGYGAGHRATRWLEGDTEMYRLSDGPAQIGELIAVTDDGAAILWKDGNIVGFGKPIGLPSRPLASWSR